MAIDREKRNACARRFYAKNRNRLNAARAKHRKEYPDRYKARNKAARIKHKAKIAAGKKLWHERNREQILQKQKQYRLDNEERLKAAQRHYREANKVELAAKRKAYNEAHKEQIKIKKREYYLKNQERFKERAKRFRAEHPDVIKERSRKHYEANKPKVRLRIAKWQNGNPQKVMEIKRAACLNRVARSSKAEGRYTADDVRVMYDRQHGLCAAFGCSLANGFHVDHIIPLSRGGSNWPENLQLLCPKCNCRKHTLTMVEFMERNGTGNS